MNRALIYFLLIVIFINCSEDYKYTRKECNKMYLEVYNINSAGVDRCYLTDSLNFKIKIGSFDNEHQIYKISCNDDNVNIFKESSGEKNCKWVIENGRRWFRCDKDTLNRKVYKISELKDLKNIN
jgi:hypothetical protein